MPETTPRPAALAQLPKLRSPADEKPQVTGGFCVSGDTESETPSPSDAFQFVKWEVPVTDQAPALVRRRAVAVLDGWGMAEVARDAATVLTELVTNARQAGATRMVVLVEADTAPDLVEVCVWDDAPGVPCKQEPDPCSERGRGLLMVEALAVAWGHHPLSLDAEHPGKVVWAALARSGK